MCFRRKLKYVRVGDLDHNSDKDDTAARQFNIIETFAHPDYKSKSQYADVGLIKIDGSFVFNEYIQPLCLSDVGAQVTSRLIVAGIGRTEQHGGVKSHVQRVQLTFSPHAECQSAYLPSSRIIDNETQICAGPKKGEPDTCAVN